MENYKIIFKELPIDQVEQDSEQPRKNFRSESEQSLNRLLKSIETYGIEEPIKVMQVEENRYKIMDGHRRHTCAGILKWTHVPCIIYPDMDLGEFEARRYEIQNNRRNWKPFEKSNSLHRIKTTLGLQSNKQLAELLHLSVTIVSNSLQIREQKVEYLDLFAEYQLTESYKIEFIRLKPKLRKIKNFETDDIVRIIFEKIKHDVIRNSHEFRKLSKIFARAAANEEEIYKFLNDPDMTVSELDQKTIQSGFSLVIEQAIQQITSKRKTAVAFSSKEEGLLKQLAILLNKIF